MYTILVGAGAFFLASLAWAYFVPVLGFIVEALGAIIGMFLDR